MGRAGGIPAVEGRSHCWRGRQSAARASFFKGTQESSRERRLSRAQVKSTEEHRGKPFQEQAEADAREGHATGSKMLKSPPPPDSSPNICSLREES